MSMVKLRYKGESHGLQTKLEFKFPEQRRKSHLKSDLVLFETSARLPQLANFVTIVREIAWS